MRNRELWTPSKFVLKNGRLKASREQVGVGSRLMADLIANFYFCHLRHHARGKLLDLGCGKVPLFEAYKDLVTENVCVDWENTSHKSPYLDFKCDLSKALPFKDEEFDTIILSDVLEHLPQPENIWREMARVLAKKGKILMNVPFYYWLHEQPHDYYRYTEFALRRFVENTGLKVILLKSLGGVPEVLTDIIAKSAQRLPKVGFFVGFFVECLSSIFITTKFGKKISKGTEASFPYGYYLVAQK